MTTLKLPSLISIRLILKVGGIFSLEARDMDTKLLSAPESNNTLARLTVTGSRLLPVAGLLLQFLDQMAHRVKSFDMCKVLGMMRGFLSLFVCGFKVILCAVVGVGVTVVVVVESSSVVKLSFLLWEITDSVSSKTSGYDQQRLPVPWKLIECGKHYQQWFLMAAGVMAGASDVDVLLDACYQH
ncbi:hypothetical protein Tco_0261002 [Tanacetum coccineum]